MSVLVGKKLRDYLGAASVQLDRVDCTVRFRVSDTSSGTYLVCITLFEGRCSIQLSYGRICSIDSKSFVLPANTILEALGIITFSGANGAMKASVVYDNQVTFAGTKIEDFHIDDRALASYAGVYRSGELDATYKLFVEQGSLMLRMNWNPPIKLQPLVPNEFGGADMTLVFRKDSNNGVSGLTVFAGWNGWIRNERFEKSQLNPHPK
jgi:hypothetical protein